MRGHFKRSRSLLGWMMVLFVALSLALEAGTAMEAAAPSLRGDHNKKPLTDKDLNSGAFRRLLETTGASILELTILYQTSGAEDFKEFSQALMVSRMLGLDHGLVLRALHSQDLGDVLQDLGVSEKQADQARKIAKKELEKANERWENGR